MVFQIYFEQIYFEPYFLSVWDNCVALNAGATYNKHIYEYIISD